MRALVVVLALLAGCTDQTVPEPEEAVYEPSPRFEGLPFDDVNRSIVAAVVSQTCGGIAGWCSGQSAVVYLSGGGVVAIDGREWGPGRNETTCGVVAPIFDRLATLGGNFTVACPADADAIHAAILDDRDHRRLLGVMLSLAPLDVPAANQTTECCDRVYTVAHTLVTGNIDHVVWEHPAGSPAKPVDGDRIGRLIVTMDAIGEWLASQQV